MRQLEFIAHEGLRLSLQADVQELEQCLDVGAWKAAIVLSGSVVEAILIDSLSTGSYQKKTGKDPLTMDLATIVIACKAEGIIGARGADLSSVIRSYRNLIHPGRVIRLNETVDESTARIAHALVGMIADEAAANRARTFGLTATQLTSKIENDSLVEPILPHLLKEVPEVEREKLLLNTLPQRYFELRKEDHFDEESYFLQQKCMERLQRCYRSVLASSSDHVRKRVATKFVRMIRSDTDSVISGYGTAFFRASDMSLLDGADVSIVKDHLMSRIGKGVTQEIMPLVSGLEGFLAIEDVDKWLGALLKPYLSDSSSKEYRDELQSFISSAYDKMAIPLKNATLRRLDSLNAAFKAKGFTSSAETIGHLKEFLDLPF